jgi:hypothetical protein
VPDERLSRDMPLLRLEIDGFGFLDIRQAYVINYFACESGFLGGLMFST